MPGYRTVLPKLAVARAPWSALGPHGKGGAPKAAAPSPTAWPRERWPPTAGLAPRASWRPKLWLVTPLVTETGGESAEQAGTDRDDGQAFPEVKQHQDDQRARDTTPGGRLITQRSRVQIPPPPPSLTSTFGASPPSQRDSWTGCCQSFVSGGPGLRSGPFAWAGTVENQTRHGVSGRRVHARDDVAVDVQGDGDSGVTEALADHLGRNTGSQRRGRVAVADIVQPDRGQPGRAGQPPEPVGDQVRMDREPSGRVNTSPESLQATPTSACSCAWRALCSWRAATVAGSSASDRLPIRVLGSDSCTT
jgi:hypothetical protein